MVVVARLTEQVCQHLSSHIFRMFQDRPSIGKAKSSHPEDTYQLPTPTRHKGMSLGRPGSLVSDKHPAYLLLVLCQSFLPLWSRPLETWTFSARIESLSHNLESVPEMAKETGRIYSIHFKRCLSKVLCETNVTFLQHCHILIPQYQNLKKCRNVEALRLITCICRVLNDNSTPKFEMLVVLGCFILFIKQSCDICSHEQSTKPYLRSERYTTEESERLLKGKPLTNTSILTRYHHMSEYSNATFLLKAAQPKISYPN